jgi:Cadherin-like
MGLREAVVTRYVRPDCVSPCSQSRSQCTSGSCDDADSQSGEMWCPAGTGATVHQPDAGSDFGGGLTSPSFGVSPSSSLDQVVRVRDVVVREGGSSQLTEANIDLAPGLLRAALNSTRGRAALRVVRPPMYGELFLTGTATAVGWTGRGSRPTITAAASTFTLADVTDGRIVYVHDGSESTVDSFGLEIDLTGIMSGGGGGGTEDQQLLPEVLHGRRKHAFSVVVQVAPWNDRPSITLPPDDTLSIIAGTEIQLTPELLNASDADDAPVSVELSVQYQPGVDFGYFETIDSSGVRRARVTRFTQADVEAGRVKFVHRGSLVQQLKLQVK